jgi:Flp pilus assembly protein TadB
VHPRERCPTFSGQLIHKSRNRLFLAAFAYLLAAVALILWLPAMRIAIVIAIISGLTAAYLFVWAWLGRAVWCRQCKRFPMR